MLFQGGLFHQKKVSKIIAPSEIHKQGSRPKYFNKNIDTYNSGPPKAMFDRHIPAVKSVFFKYPYDHINTMGNTNDYTHLVEAHEEHIR